MSFIGLIIIIDRKTLVWNLRYDPTQHRLGYVFFFSQIRKGIKIGYKGCMEAFLDFFCKYSKMKILVLKKKINKIKVYMCEK